MKTYQGYLTLIGTVVSIDPDRSAFVMRCRGGDDFTVFIGHTTAVLTLRNLDELDRDRFPDPPDIQAGEPAGILRKYVNVGHLISAQGIYHEYEGQSPSFEARTVHLLQSPDGSFFFEATHWWITQIARMADRWLDDFFGDKRTYEQDDFAALYRTNLNIVGLPTDDSTQECATLSRLIYGLTSAYMLTGADRYLQAAKAAVKYQRETFRSLSHDGRYCFWAFGRRRGRYGAKILLPSENPDDYGAIALYEQIYALTGLCHYYRITAEWEVLDDIQRTVRTFNKYFLDTSGRGYFSHLDYATLRPDAPSLGQNQSRKNWNSIGDHLPAYLIDLILALEPLPAKQGGDIEEFLKECKWMLEETTDLIASKFPDPHNPYVNERFHADWTPDHEWGWQQNRAIIGHNLKIAWNLTRVANYYRYLAAQPTLRGSNGDAAARYEKRAAELMAVAEKLGNDMVVHGIDQVRSGVFDAVERENLIADGLNFVWGNTKDFWQQEQGILAYLVLHGYSGKQHYLDLARELSAFWNLFFLDHDNQGVFFRTNDNGTPIIQGNYGSKSGHSTGYHAPELNFLAHLYVRSYVACQGDGEGDFCLFFKPSEGTGRASINVLPDFYRPGSVLVKSISVNGERRRTVDQDNFQIELRPDDLGCQIAVEFTPAR
jgi:mannose/cellobiose epimerase-like protein (N-acyl-D-glucosamine 2-epimerase family)